MTLRSLLLAPFALALTQTALPARAEEPVEMVRKLSDLQNRLALGDLGARSAAAKQAEQIEDALEEAAPETWKEPKNVRAAAIYLLAGGQAGAIRQAYDAGFFNEEPLIVACIAYAEGRKLEAKKGLLAVDARAVPATLGGYLALVQGSLLMGADNKRAIELFDLARVLMPGTLIEEGALRREIAVMNRVDPGKLLILGNRYVARYLRSPFAKNFWDALGNAALRIALSADEAAFAPIDDLFRQAPPPTKFEVDLAIARKAVLTGRAQAIVEYVDKARPFAGDPQLQARLKFYEAVIATLSGDYEKGLPQLQQTAAKSLPRADAEMREIVLGAVKRLEEEPENGIVIEELPNERPARQAVAEADELLKRIAGR